VDVGAVEAFSRRIVLVRFDRRELAGREDAFRFVVHPRSIGVVRQLARRQVDAEDLGLLVVIGTENQFPLERWPVVLGLQGGAEREVATVENLALIDNLRGAVLVDDVAFVNLRRAGRHLAARKLRRPIRPGNVHPPARWHWTLCRLDAERLRPCGAGRIEHEQPAIGARRTDVGGVELGRTRQQDVAIRQVQRTRKAKVRKVRGQVADDAGRQIDLHGVAERLGEKEHALAVERELGPFTKPRQLLDVRRKVAVGRHHAGRRGGWRLLARQFVRCAESREHQAAHFANSHRQLRDGFYNQRAPRPGSDQGQTRVRHRSDPVFAATLVRGQSRLSVPELSSNTAPPKPQGRCAI
jgi:hypothetical protein